ncbi:PREDICTED: BRCT domain-containing protein At4g02110-like isoform X2 [Tarenaya hassleriana]|uniref:BRCT domain-containing protein At4g02110-like isoform X2 n=1 Tax=Tarenaya hassleriana TaxID=28532 RepID=UPI00053CA5B1|nr:PREDICTED: BRCT domain-containing protein At4g02110-like isoform X2 [Tarenaya hassleriana]
MMESSSSPKPFLGIRFALVGFNPIDGSKLRSKLVNCGGVDIGRYSQDYTHLIVDKLVYEDPICVAARNSGKIVVLGSWVDHCFDIGVLVDANSVLYRPPKDLNGIPGAKSLIVCLTGYQRQDRDDIMAMVALMGGQFSKPLVANKVTHLVCYKFEGEKYELAKRMKKIKLVNHQWLEDCLKEWKLLPEADYEMSGFELEMMEATAKDSEDEAEDVSLKRANKSPLGLRVSVAVDGTMPNSEERNVSVSQAKSATQEDSSNTNASKDLWLTPKKVNRVRPNEAMASTGIDASLQHDCGKTSTIQDASHGTNPLEEKSESREMKDGPTSISKSTTNRLSPMVPKHVCLKTNTFQDASHDALLNSLAKSPDSTEVKDDMTSTYKSTERLPSPARNMCSLTYSRKRDFVAEETNVLEDPCKSDNVHGKESLQMLPQKRLADGHVNGSKSRKVGCTSEVLVELESISPEQNHVFVSSICGSTEGRELAHKLPATDSTTKSLSSNVIDMKDVIPTSENMPLKGALTESIGKKMQERSLTGLVMEKSSMVSGLDLLVSDNKTEPEQPNKKTASKKTLGMRPKLKNSGNQKGSIYLSKTALSNDLSNCLSNGKVASLMLESDNQKEMSIPAINFESMLEMAKQIDSGDKAFEKFSCTDGETNPPEEKVSHEYDTAVNKDRLVVIEGEVEVRSVGAEVNDGSNEDGPDDTTEPEVDGNTSKCGKDASGENISTGNAKKRDLRTAEVGKVYTRKKKSRKEYNLRGNDNEMKDKGDNSVEETEDVSGNKSSGKISEDQSSTIGKPHARNKTAKSSKTLTKADKLSGKINSTSKSMFSRNALQVTGKKSACFIVNGLRFQKKEYQKIVRRLKGKVCRDSHQWSYQATHFIAPEIRRTEKFFAAAASGSWILHGDYLPACSQAGKFLPEEPFEWHGTGLSQDSVINLAAPRKWRLIREKTGHGAFYGMRIVIYGDCIVPSLDTLKRAVIAGDGTILATAPPYKRFLNADTDFAVVSPGVPRANAWIQEFLSHEIPCVVADYLVEYVCKSGYPLDKHVLYNTNVWAERSFNKLLRITEGER